MQHLETRKSVVAFASLGAACTVMDEIGGGGQGKVAFDRACPSVTQKRPLVSHFPTAVGSARPRKRIYRLAGVQQTALENESGYWRNKGGRQCAAGERPWWSDVMMFKV